MRFLYVFDLCYWYVHEQVNFLVINDTVQYVFAIHQYNNQYHTFVAKKIQLCYYKFISYFLNLRTVMWTISALIHVYGKNVIIQMTVYKL